MTLTHVDQTEWTITSRTNGRPFSRRQIGWRIIRGPRMTSRCGESARDYTQIGLPPGKYPLYAARDCGTRWHSLLCPVPGIVVSHLHDWLKPGEPATADCGGYAHAIADGILNTPGFNHIELLDGVTAERHNFEYNGKPHHTHVIRVNGESV
tara:strand:- start:966 stop:1421 length:456 start_codon:yes stop_codon:yes gene_type:complete